MTNTCAYIHEFVDIRGANRANYMHHMTANWSPNAREDRNQRCFGVWGVLGSTGRWPQVCNIWEEDGLSGLADSFAGETVGAGLQDPKLEKWLGKNQWFGQDRLMTRAAQAIHEQLVLEEDFDPTSDDYYKEIDSRMRKEMPNKFQEKRSNAQTVAPASGNGRSVKSGRKKAVELTPGQVAFAKKMRIPLDKYAKEVAKLENRSQ